MEYLKIYKGENELYNGQLHNPYIVLKIEIFVESSIKTLTGINSQVPFLIIF